MESERSEKIKRAIDNLERALKSYKTSNKEDDLPFLTVCKALEVLVEYIWKELKFKVEEEGLFASSPREAVRQAATLEIITHPEKWLAIITARNDSVHDYFSIPAADYIALAEEFPKLVRKMIKG